MVNESLFKFLDTVHMWCILVSAKNGEVGPLKCCLLFDAIISDLLLLDVHQTVYALYLEIFAALKGTFAQA